MASLTSTTVILSNMLATVQVDGSETGETIPTPPVNTEATKGGLFIVYDSGGDGDNNWVNGTVLFGVYFRPSYDVSPTKSKAPPSLPHKQVSRAYHLILNSLFLPLAAQKRRKSFTVARSEASKFFARTCSRTAASSGIGSPFWRASFFVAM
jgi:hypothetical protein